MKPRQKSCKSEEIELSDAEILVDLSHDVIPGITSSSPVADLRCCHLCGHLVGPLVALLFGYPILCLLLSFVSLISWNAVKRSGGSYLVLASLVLWSIQCNLSFLVVYRAFAFENQFSMEFSHQFNSFNNISNVFEYVSTSEVVPVRHIGAGVSIVHSFLEGRHRTLSVVVPCINEREYAVKTVQSIVDATAANILFEIVVVDDASDPPLEPLFNEMLEEKYLSKIKIIRNNVQVGLIGAKLRGGNAATGDVICFLDCHVKPDPGWERELMERTGDNYKRIVVPIIGSLNPHTWQTIGHNGNTKCYLTFDADFPWIVTDKFQEVPIMSGGLLALTKQWWDESGGLDSQMTHWGGENIDQSIRAWLCGAEIVSAQKSFVAHMWRDDKDPDTKVRYVQKTGSVIRNRLRAITAWFQRYRQKALQFPEFRGYFAHEGLEGDLNAFTELRDRLQCKPFSWFLWRFRQIYDDAGVIPHEVYSLRHTQSRMCLTVASNPSSRGSHAIELSKCSADSSSNARQRFHDANWNPEGKCCSGTRLWNYDRCLLTSGSSLTLANSCAVTGGQPGQKIQYQNGQIRSSDGCLRLKQVQHPVLSSEQCSEALSSPWPHQLFFKDEINEVFVHSATGLCLGYAEYTDKATGQLILVPCEGLSTGNISGSSKKGFFTGRSVLLDTFFQRKDSTFLINDHASPQITDSSDGKISSLRLRHVPDVVYRLHRDDLPVYTIGSNSGSCFGIPAFDIDGILPRAYLRSCSQDAFGEATPGQRFEKHYASEVVPGAFQLRDRHLNLCIKYSELGPEPRLDVCDATGQQKDFLFVVHNNVNMRNLGNNHCFDTNDGENLLLYPCYDEGVNPKQNFQTLPSGNVLADILSKCIDFVGVGFHAEVEFGSCLGGRQWDKVLRNVPLERQYYEDDVKMHDF